MGQITPDMLKKRRKNSGNSDKEETKEDDKSVDDRAEHKSKNGEDAEPEPVTKRRPQLGMGLPGMGFGGNVLAEMKMKKLNKSKNPESAENGKPDTEQSAPRPFGRGMLKKTVRSPTSPTEKKEDANSNNNNNKAAPKSAPNRWKSKSFEKEKPDISPKPVSKGPPLPRKPSPPPLSAKPGKGSPPPLPSKPKPAARPGSLSRGARSRPVSEFVDPKRVPSSIKDRASSWVKKSEK